MPDAASPKGLRLFLDEEQQRAWMESGTALVDGERPDFHETLEQRFKYADRLERLRRLPQGDDVVEILRLYAATCLPIPRATERWYWSVSCLPGSPDKPLARVNASWMELFALMRDGGDGVRARIILHLNDFTVGGSSEPDQLDTDLLESCVDRPENLTHAIWRNGKGILIAKVRSAASIRAFLVHPHGLRAIRRFNLTHMNRGRNAYEASHCFSLADHMLGDA